MLKAGGTNVFVNIYNEDIDTRSLRFDFEDEMRMVYDNSEEIKLINEMRKKDPRYKTVVCTHWYNGLCMKGDKCEFLHELDLERVPECQKGQNCTNKDCPLRHLRDEERAECNNYLLGFCPSGKACRYQHRKLPPEQLPEEANWHFASKQGIEQHDNDMQMHYGDDAPTGYGGTAGSSSGGYGGSGNTGAGIGAVSGERSERGERGGRDDGPASHEMQKRNAESGAPGQIDGMPYQAGGFFIPNEPPRDPAQVSEKQRYWKTQLCENWKSADDRTCQYGDRCHFAHGEAEMRTTSYNLRAAEHTARKYYNDDSITFDIDENNQTSNPTSIIDAINTCILVNPMIPPQLQEKRKQIPLLYPQTPLDRRILEIRTSGFLRTLPENLLPEATVNDSRAAEQRSNFLREAAENASKTANPTPSRQITHIDGVMLPDIIQNGPGQFQIGNYKYIILRSTSFGSLAGSLKHNIWTVYPHFMDQLNRAFATSEKVFLLFIVNDPEMFAGMALLKSAVKQQLNHPNIILPPDAQGMGFYVDVEWLQTCELLPAETVALESYCRDLGRMIPVCLALNCMEVPPTVGHALTVMIYKHSIVVDLENIGDDSCVEPHPPGPDPTVAQLFDESRYDPNFRREPYPPNINGGEDNPVYSESLPIFEPAFVFGISDNKIFEEAWNLEMFGAPAMYAQEMSFIQPGTILFAFDIVNKRYYGVYEATSHAEYLMQRDAFINPNDKSDLSTRISPLPIQVRFRVLMNCAPLAETEISGSLLQRDGNSSMAFRTLQPGVAQRLTNLFAKDKKQGECLRPLLTMIPTSSFNIFGTGENVETYPEGFYAHQPVQVGPQWQITATINIPFDPRFKAANRLIGKNGANIKRIQDESGCTKVRIKAGKEAPAEGVMEMIIEGPTEESVVKACEMGKIALDDIVKQWEEYQERGRQMREATRNNLSRNMNQPMMMPSSNANFGMDIDDNTFPNPEEYQPPSAPRAPPRGGPDGFSGRGRGGRGGRGGHFRNQQFINSESRHNADNASTATSHIGHGNDNASQNFSETASVQTFATDNQSAVSSRQPASNQPPKRAEPTTSSDKPPHSHPSKSETQPKPSRDNDSKPSGPVSMFPIEVTGGGDANKGKKDRKRSRSRDGRRGGGGGGDRGRDRDRERDRDRDRPKKRRSRSKRRR